MNCSLDPLTPSHRKCSTDDGLKIQIATSLKQGLQLDQEKSRKLIDVFSREDLTALFPIPTSRGLGNYGMQNSDIPGAAYVRFKITNKYSGSKFYFRINQSLNQFDLIFEALPENDKYLKIQPKIHTIEWFSSIFNESNDEYELTRPSSNNNAPILSNEPRESILLSLDSANRPLQTFPQVVPLAKHEALFFRLLAKSLGLTVEKAFSLAGRVRLPDDLELISLSKKQIQESNGLADLLIKKESNWKNGQFGFVGDFLENSSPKEGVSLPQLCSGPISGAPEMHRLALPFKSELSFYIFLTVLPNYTKKPVKRYFLFEYFDIENLSNFRFTIRFFDVTYNLKTGIPHHYERFQYEDEPSKTIQLRNLALAIFNNTHRQFRFSNPKGCLRIKIKALSSNFGSA